MLNQDDPSTPTDTDNVHLPENGNNQFFPKGAIAFFILLVMLALVFWYGIYFLMIERT